jgi:hypothetical protein
MQTTIGYAVFAAALVLIAWRSYRATKRYGSKRVWNAAYLTMWVVLLGTGVMRATAITLDPENAEYYKALDDGNFYLILSPVLAFMLGPWLRIIRDVGHRGLTWAHVVATRAAAS